MIQCNYLREEEKEKVQVQEFKQRGESKKERVFESF